MLAGILQLDGAPTHYQVWSSTLIISEQHGDGCSLLNWPIAGHIHSTAPHSPIVTLQAHLPYPDPRWPDLHAG